MTSRTDSDALKQLPRKLWKKHGGDWHGPRVERWTMPENNVPAFIAEVRADSTELIALRKERDALRDALFEALNEGLIYWAPNTSRGHERKGDMIDRFEKLLLNGVKS